MKACFTGLVISSDFPWFDYGRRSPPFVGVKRYACVTISYISRYMTNDTIRITIFLN